MSPGRMNPISPYGFLLMVVAVMQICPTGGEPLLPQDYPNVDYRPRYHISCDAGKLDYPSFAYVTSVTGSVAHVLYHCSPIPGASDQPDVDTWHHVTSTNMVSWMTSSLSGVPNGTVSVSILQPSNSTVAYMAITKSDGVYLAKSTDLSLTEWTLVSTYPVATLNKPLYDAHIWMESENQYSLLVGSSVNSSSVEGQHADVIVSALYIFGSTDLMTWTPHGLFSEGKATGGTTATSVDYYNVANANGQFSQQVECVTCAPTNSTFCLTGSYDFNSTSGAQFSIRGQLQEDYGTLSQTSSISDELGRRLVIGLVDEMRSEPWQAHDQRAGVISLPRVAMPVSGIQVMFGLPEDVSSLYGKSLGRLDGLTLAADEREYLPLLSGNQMTILATLTINPQQPYYSVGFRLLASENMSEFTEIAISNSPSPLPDSCMKSPDAPGMDRLGLDYYVLSTGTVEECKQLCCDDSRCKSYVYAWKLMVKTGINCTVGSNCCFLKSGQPAPTKSTLNLTSGTPRDAIGGVLSVSTLNSSLSPEAKKDTTQIPLHTVPATMNTERRRHGQMNASKEYHSRASHEASPDKTTSQSGVGAATGTLNIQIFIDHSVLEVFVQNSLVVTERVYPTRADSLGVELFASNATAVFSSLEAYEMQNAFDN